MSTEHKKPTTKKSKASKPLSKPQLKQIQKSLLGQILSWIWRGLVFLSLLLNFYLGYLVLTPNISIVYLPHIFPQYEIGLPIKITNHGYLSIYDAEAEFFSNLVLEHDLIISNNIVKVSVKSKLFPKESIEYIYDQILVDNKPIKGSIQVKVTYKLSFFKIKSKSEETFHVMLDKYNQIIWMTK